MSVPRWYPDLSSNNGPADMTRVVQAGVPVVAIKATEGLGYVNPYHHNQTIQVHEQYTGVVHYHFCRPELGNPLGEAAFFWAAVRPVWRPWDRLMLDLEVTAEFADVYMGEIGNFAGQYAKSDPIGYASQSYYDGTSDINTTPLIDTLSSHHWVIADYGQTAHTSGQDLLWAQQTTSTGHWPGVQGVCDLNFMNYRIAVEASAARAIRKLGGER